MRESSDGYRSPSRVWRAPAILSLLTLSGLTASLLSDGRLQLLAWTGMGTPLIAFIYELGKSNQTR